MTKKVLSIVFLAAMSLPTTALAQCQWQRSWYPRVYRGYGYGGYGYGRGYWGYQCSTGVKFHLDLVADGDRKEVKRGIVSVDGNEFGTVNRFDGFWNGILPVPPGQHEVALELADGRKFRTVVALSFGTVVSVYPRFRPEGNGETVAEPAPTPAPQAAPASTTSAPEVVPSASARSEPPARRRLLGPRSSQARY